MPFSARRTRRAASSRSTQENTTPILDDRGQPPRPGRRRPNVATAMPDRVRRLSRARTLQTRTAQATQIARTRLNGRRDADLDKAQKRARTPSWTSRGRTAPSPSPANEGVTRSSRVGNSDEGQLETEKVTLADGADPIRRGRREAALDPRDDSRHQQVVLPSDRRSSDHRENADRGTPTANSGRCGPSTRTAARTSSRSRPSSRSAQAGEEPASAEDRELHGHGPQSRPNARPSRRASETRKATSWRIP